MTGGGVAVAGRVAKECFQNQWRCCEEPGCVAIEGIKTQGRITGTECEAEEGVSTQGGVEAGITSTWRWIDRLCRGRKPKAGER